MNHSSIFLEQIIFPQKPHKFEQPREIYFLTNKQKMEATTYTPEQIKHAMERLERARLVEHNKYLRNKERRLAYSKAYYETHKEEIAEKHRLAYAAKHPKKVKAATDPEPPTA
jgi:hypothetical protein